MCSKSKILVIMSGLFLALLMGLSSNRVKADGEPPLIDILTIELGFDVDLTDVETFPAGSYEITLYAEYAGYRDENESSWYKVGTSEFNVIFYGPEGAAASGMIDPPYITKSFISNEEFGLSLWSPDQGGHRFFTETHLNPDAPVKHAMVYQNLDDPTMFLIGFENLEGGGDFDYNDMVFSLKRIIPVGGVWTPVEKFDLLAPWISLISAMVCTVAVSGVVVKRKKKIK